MAPGEARQTVVLPLRPPGFTSLCADGRCLQPRLRGPDGASVAAEADAPLRRCVMGSAPAGASAAEEELGR